MGRQTTSLLLLGGWMLSVPEKSSIREWKSLGFMMFMLSGQHCFLPRTLPQIHMNPCFGHIPMSRIFVSRFLYPLKFPKGKLLAIILILVLPKNGLATCPRWTLLLRRHVLWLNLAWQVESHILYIVLISSKILPSSTSNYSCKKALNWDVTSSIRISMLRSGCHEGV